MEAVNTYQVFDWLWTSGQLSAADIQRLPELGIQVVINLALPSSPNALPDEAERVSGLGMVYVHIPVEWEAPRPEQFQQFVGVLKAFEGHNIWLHCVMNMRVSAFIYLYRNLVLGEVEEVSAFPMRIVWQPDETWQAFIATVALTWKSSPEGHQLT